MTCFCEVCKDERPTAYTDDGELVCSDCGSDLSDAAAIGLHVREEPYIYPEYYDED